MEGGCVVTTNRMEGDFVYLQRIEWKVAVYLQRIQWKATLCTYSELNGRRLCVLTAN